MAKVTLNVKIVNTALLTEEEIKEQDRRWELVGKLLKNKNINAKKFALSKEEKEKAIQDLLNK